MKEKILGIGIIAIALILAGCTTTTIPDVGINASNCQIQQCGATANPTCGNLPEGGLVCPLIYMYSDVCLSLVKCEISNNTCQTIKDPKYDSCYQCYTNCANNSNFNESDECRKACDNQFLGHEQP